MTSPYNRTDGHSTKDHEDLINQEYTTDMHRFSNQRIIVQYNSYIYETNTVDNYK